MGEVFRLTVVVGLIGLIAVMWYREGYRNGRRRGWREGMEHMVRMDWRPPVFVDRWVRKGEVMEHNIELTQISREKWN